MKMKMKRRNRLKQACIGKIRPCWFQIVPRKPEYGGGWRLQCFKHGVEVFGGAYPENDNTDWINSFNDAHSDAEDWMRTETKLPRRFAPTEPVDTAKLAALTQAEITAVKAIITSQTDRFRKPWQKVQSSPVFLTTPGTKK